MYSKSFLSTIHQVAPDNIFSGLMLRWKVLTQSEKITALLISLTPLWWLMGWKHFFILMALGLLAYDILHYGKNCFKSPSLSVIALLSFWLYTLSSGYFYSALQNDSLSPNAIFSSLNTYAGPAIILWYLQSYKIRIRWQVVAWSFSVVTVLMLFFWIVIYFGWQQAHYDPPRSLYGFLTGKSTIYVPGAGNSNYLIPYFATDESFILGFVRYVYFFSGPEALALIAGFIGLLTLEIKSRAWSFSLFIAAAFILLTSGTRSVVIIFPLLLVLHSLSTIQKSFGLWFLCLILAALSFTTLSLPPITNQLFSTVTTTVEVTGEARADSTEVRGDIYRGTLEGIIQGDNRQFLLGYVTTGKTVLPGYDPARIGSHSFWLGTLLYRSGIVGSLIFIVFWISLIWQACRKTAQSLSICKLVFLMLTVTLLVMEIEMPVMAITLLCVVMQKND